ncbi:MAG TPA: GNAT family N-acetyltransferase [Candidatus Cybelea sp.]|nr:GNAT family N-acetyltransferase [Candidatus Cybelea sp.]
MLSIRPAVAEDAALLKTLIYEFADFYRFPVSITEEQLVRDGFGPQPKFQVLIAESSGHPAGYALFFDYYSSFHGRALYLEDLFIRPQFRGGGAGQALFAHVAEEGAKRGCDRVLFNVLNSNHPAIRFYKKLGATFSDDWKVVCLEGSALEGLAAYHSGRR